MTAIDPKPLLEAACGARAHAHAPYSGYRVGAALLDVDGTVHTGCNVENASYGLTICAERTAVGAALASGARRFRALAIVADGDRPPFPCGACRQVLAEFCDADLPVFIAAGDRPETVEERRLGELLPDAFAASTS